MGYYLVIKHKTTILKKVRFKGKIPNYNITTIKPSQVKEHGRYNFPNMNLYTRNKNDFLITYFEDIK